MTVAQPLCAQARVQSLPNRSDATLSHGNLPLGYFFKEPQTLRPANDNSDRSVRLFAQIKLFAAQQISVLFEQLMPETMTLANSVHLDKSRPPN